VLESPELADNAQFTTNSERVANREALHEEIEGAFEHFTEKEAIVRLEEAGIANARLRTVRQFLDHLQLKTRGCWREVESPAGPLWALPPPATPAGVEPIMAPIPGVGEHTGENLGGLEREERPESLDEVRKSIDAVDREIVRLLGERKGYVRQAALQEDAERSRGQRAGRGGSRQSPGTRREARGES
jgi:crotonobetainyl-CoA:carnitine CoA-transferase CaiB-like acyl-CoA transferase